MRRRSLGLALASLALLAPATADAKAKAVEPYKVLVVTSTTDALTTAGMSAITAASAPTASSRRPRPAAVGAQFTPAGPGHIPRGRVPEHGHGEPADRRAARELRGVLQEGRRLRRHRLGDRDRPVLAVPDRRPRHALVGPHRVAVAARSRSSTASTTRARTCREYWERTDNCYNFTTNVRGVSHVLATRRRGPVRPAAAGQRRSTASPAARWAPTTRSPSARTTRAAARSTPALGNTRGERSTPTCTTHLKGAISWAAGQSDPVYSDCGATVLKNYQQTKISAPPNLQRADRLRPAPGRPHHPDRAPRRRAPAQPGDGHDARSSPTSPTRALPPTQRIYTELRGRPLRPGGRQRTSPPTSGCTSTTRRRRSPDVKLSDGSIVTQTTPNTTPPNTARVARRRGIRTSATSSSRASSSSRTPTAPRLDLDSEQQILRVANNRQECCHVAGDIDFDKHSNLWLVTGDDTPAGGINAGGYGPFNDQLTDEQQTVRVTNATGGTFTLTFNGQTTAPLAVQRDGRAGRRGARGAVEHRRRTTIQTSGGPVNTANVNVFFRRALAAGRPDADHGQRRRPHRHRRRRVATTTAQEGGWYQRPTGDARRSTLNTNDLRGKILRIKVKDATSPPPTPTRPTSAPAPARTRSRPATCSRSSRGAPQAKTRPEVYAMGFRNPFRIQVDENDVAYVTDYSPDAQHAAARPRPGRRRPLSRSCASRPTTAGRRCYTSELGYYKWNFHEFAPGTTTAGHPAAQPAAADRLRRPDAAQRLALERRRRPGASSPACASCPPVTDPDIWYSYRDNNAGDAARHAVLRLLRADPGPDRAGLDHRVPAAVPGALHRRRRRRTASTKYNYDPANPNPKKFPPYYDDSVILGEFDAGHACARSSSTRRTACSRSTTSWTAARRTSPTRTFPFECDNPMDMQFGARTARSTC